MDQDSSLRVRGVRFELGYTITEAIEPRPKATNQSGSSDQVAINPLVGTANTQQSPTPPN